MILLPWGRGQWRLRDSVFCDPTLDQLQIELMRCWIARTPKTLVTVINIRHNGSACHNNVATRGLFISLYLIVASDRNKLSGAKVLQSSYSR